MILIFMMRAQLYIFIYFLFVYFVTILCDLYELKSLYTIRFYGVRKLILLHATGDHKNHLTIVSRNNVKELDVSERSLFNDD